MWLVEASETIVHPGNALFISYKDGKLGAKKGYINIAKSKSEAKGNILYIVSATTTVVPGTSFVFTSSSRALLQSLPIFLQQCAARKWNLEAESEAIANEWAEKLNAAA